MWRCSGEVIEQPLFMFGHHLVRSKMKHKVEGCGFRVFMDHEEEIFTQSPISYLTQLKRSITANLPDSFQYLIQPGLHFDCTRAAAKSEVLAVFLSGLLSHI